MADISPNLSPYLITMIGIALDPRDGSMYVADFVARSVLKYCTI